MKWCADIVPLLGTAEKGILTVTQKEYDWHYTVTQMTWVFLCKQNKISAQEYQCRICLFACMEGFYLPAKKLLQFKFRGIKMHNIWIQIHDQNKKIEQDWTHVHKDLSPSFLEYQSQSALEGKVT